MTNKTINDLESVVTLADADLIPVWQGTTTRKTTVSSVRTALTTALPFSAITGDPNDNVALKAELDGMKADITALEAQTQMKLLAHGSGNVSAPTTGLYTVNIPFPVGYNATTSAIIVSPAYLIAGGTGNGVRIINLNVSAGTTSWSVSARATSEGGNDNYIKFTYMVFTTGGVAPTNYTVTPVDSSPVPEPDPGNPPDVPTEPEL